MGIIKKLEVRGLVGIKEKVIFPGKVNILRGKNGTGKTTLLEGIKVGFLNEYDRVKVINDNSGEGEIIIETDDNIELRRRVTDRRSPVTVKKDGFNQKAPQSFLEKIFGKYNFDPVKFLKADPEEQTKILMDALPIVVTEEQVREWVGEDEPLPFVDYSQHGLKVMKDLEKNFYEKRRDQNSKVDTLSNEYGVEAQKVPDGFNPDKYRNISLKDKYDELKSLQEHNEKVEKYNRFVVEMDRQIEAAAKDRDNSIAMLEAEISRLEEKIRELKRDIVVIEDENKEKIKELMDRKEKAQKWLNSEENQPVEEEVINTLDKEIEDFEDNKKLVETYDRVERLKKEIEKEDKKADNLDRIVKLLREKPKELMKQANVPIPGLEIRDGLIYVNNRPVKDFSKGESIPIAVNFARAFSKDIKVIILDEIQSLDPENLQIFMEEIMKDDFQYWITEPTADEEMIIEAITATGVRMNAETGEVIEGVS